MRKFAAYIIFICNKPVLSAQIPVPCHISHSEDSGKGSDGGGDYGKLQMVPCYPKLRPSGAPSISPSRAPVRSPSLGPTHTPTATCHDRNYFKTSVGRNHITCDWMKSVATSAVKVQFCDVSVAYDGKYQKLKDWCPESCEYDCAPTAAPTKSKSPTMHPTPKAQTSAPSDSPSSLCRVTPIERSNSISDQIKLIDVLNPSDLLDNSSPQSLALQWIIEDDLRHLCPGDPKLNQRYIAALLYYSMGGAAWAKSTHFLTEIDECEWFGLSCTGNGDIHYIDYDDNKLTGTIPSEIGHLTMLTGISLDGKVNELEGTIPESVGRLVHLRVIDIDENNLTGSIPNSIYGLKKLKVLDLNDNNLSGSLSESIGNMKMLEFVQLQGNEFTGSVPLNLGKLENLKTLMIENNNFNGAIAQEVCDNNLNIVTADCGGDDPKVDCDCCIYCYPLPWTYPSSAPSNAASVPCQMTPTERSDSILNQTKSNIVTNVNDLDIATSPQSRALGWIIEEDPQYLCPGDPKLNQRYIAALLYYSMGGDKWVDSSGFLTEIDECEWFGLACNDDGRIFNIDFDDNRLRGTIPPEIGHLNYVTGLILDGKVNRLEGTIPESLGRLLDLTHIDIDGNDLTGSIPESIYGLKKLKVIDLNDNNLSGSISESIGKLTMLEFLQLNGNSMSGSVPPTLENLTNLTILMLHDNNFEGVIVDGVCANKLSTLSADCGEDEAKVKCNCCTYCFPLPTTSNSSLPSTGNPTHNITNTPTISTSVPTILTSAPTILTSAPTIPVTVQPRTKCIQDPNFSVVLDGMTLDCSILEILSEPVTETLCDTNVSFGEFAQGIKNWCPTQCGFNCAL
eukprot:CAMPEP_0194289768 /NCGR_PEP_ID=MMETSP0169-20130528/39785_1 /TAXON_ID=218684 /ORGANISM="Corethron pennatum, Strain L29A3" /LENGTH=845 /DNA_ID=CAMNT_0039037155 /DNA_START=122 /DNA_END=2659 /DNA_ORIENTATION=+